MLMQHKNLFWGLWLSFVCLNSGCVLLAKWSSGIHNPRPLSPEFVISTANKKGWDTDRLLFLSEKAWAPFFEYGASFPQVFVFDHRGQVLFKRPSGASCAKGFPMFLRSLKDEKTNILPTKTQHPIVFQTLPSLQFKDGTPFEWTPTHPYIVFSFWADFAGKMSKWVDSVEHIIQQPPPTNAIHFMVNCDPIKRKKR